jgi:hemerythrin-like domain-containing protein
MKLTQQLYDEHAEVKKMLQVVTKICENLETGKELNQDHFSSVLDFLHVFVDQCHHGKEETALFPAMEKAGVQNHGGILEHMLNEHNQGRHYIKGMKEGFEKVKREDIASLNLIMENGTGYVKLLYHHIDREDNKLFPLAEEVLDEDIKVNLLDVFEKIENEVTGPGKHEKLEESLNNLYWIYVKQ